jgi:hypothetical protein
MACPAGRRHASSRLRGGGRQRPRPPVTGRALPDGRRGGGGSARPRSGRSRDVRPRPAGCARFRPRLRSSARARTARSRVVPSRRVWPGQGHAPIRAGSSSRPRTWRVRDAAAGRDRWLEAAGRAFVTAHRPSDQTFGSFRVTRRRPERSAQHASLRASGSVEHRWQCRHDSLARAATAGHQPTRSGQGVAPTGIPLRPVASVRLACRGGSGARHHVRWACAGASGGRHRRRVRR